MSIPDQIPRLLTVKEAAALLHTTADSMQSARRRGRLPAEMFVHTGVGWRVLETRLAEHIRRRTEAPEPAKPVFVVTGRERA